MQKDGRRVRVSYPFCNIQKKGTGENPDTFPGAEGETRRVFNPSCSLCEQFILCPFLLRKKMDEEFESPTLFALYRKKVPGKSRYLFCEDKTIEMFLRFHCLDLNTRHNHSTSLRFCFQGCLQRHLDFGAADKDHLDFLF